MTTTYLPAAYQAPVRWSFALLVCTWLVGTVAPPLAVADDEMKTVRTLRWSEEREAGRLSEGDVRQHPGGEPDESWTIRRDGTELAVFALATIDDPGVGGPAYMLRGMVRYEGVDPPAYLEMWNYFPDGSAFFTRTLGESGPLGRLEGTSGWRELRVPFSLATPDGGIDPRRPSRLEVSLVMPGRGEVALGPLELVQLQTPFPQLGGIFTPWWGPEIGNRIGAVLGSLMGLSGAAIGVLSGLGRARRLVNLLVGGWIVVGAGLLLAGIAAIALGQPVEVLLPLLLSGVIACAVMGALTLVVRRRYQQSEWRRMQALDAV